MKRACIKLNTNTDEQNASSMRPVKFNFVRMKRLFTFILFVSTFSITYSQQLPSKKDIVSVLKKVNEYWISQHPNPGNNQWARAAYFTGNMDLYKIYPKEQYISYANLWAINNGWELNGGVSTRHADNQCVGQTYIDLYKWDKEPQQYKIDAINISIANMVTSEKKDDWWWIDALYMAMPVFTRLGVVYNDTTYFDKMYDLYNDTKIERGLYNSESGLWYRDESFAPPYTTPNGFDSYWARGNGWVFGAHVRVLQLLPESDIHRDEYIETFKKMAQALKNRQREDGFWNVSLDDPNDFGGPETSGTSFFAYGLAWGINNQILDSVNYYSVVQKAWEGLTTIAVHENGFLGYIQGVGSNPASSQPVTEASSSDFGYGAFLLAGSECAKLANGDLPEPPKFWVDSVKVVDLNHIDVYFNKVCEVTSALDNNNYTINNNVEISHVIQSNDKTYTLVVSDLEHGYYTLTLENISSSNGDNIENGETENFHVLNILSITASGYEPNSSNYPSNTMDFNLDTRWSADGTGQWIMFDIGNIKTVESLDIAFYKGDERFAYFSIELSENGTDFTEIFNGQSGGNTLDLENFDFEDTNARFVRITGYGNNSSSWNSITEVNINYSEITKINQVTQSKFPYISPNPANDYIQINFSSHSYDTLIIAIYNLAGVMVFNKMMNLAGENYIQIKDLDLDSGLYVINIKSTSHVFNSLFRII